MKDPIKLLVDEIKKMPSVDLVYREDVEMDERYNSWHIYIYVFLDGDSAEDKKELAEMASDFIQYWRAPLSLLAYFKQEVDIEQMTLGMEPCL